MLTTEEQRMLEDNLPLIKFTVFKYFQDTYNHEEDDLIQEGFFGLYQGVKNFNPDLGYKESTYLVASIRRYLLTHISRNREDEVPSETLTRYRKVNTKMEDGLSYEEALDLIGVRDKTYRAVDHAINHLNNKYSLDYEYENDEGSVIVLEDVVALDKHSGVLSSHQVNINNTVNYLVLRETLLTVIDNLELHQYIKDMLVSVLITETPLSVVVEENMESRGVTSSAIYNAFRNSRKIVRYEIRKLGY